jgi:dephospho-CoA kinase
MLNGKFLILIAGVPASGKTRYALHLAEKLHIPVFCKDHIKEHLYEEELICS